MKIRRQRDAHGPNQAHHNKCTMRTYRHCCFTHCLQLGIALVLSKTARLLCLNHTANSRTHVTSQKDDVPAYPCLERSPELIWHCDSFPFISCFSFCDKCLLSFFLSFFLLLLSCSVQVRCPEVQPEAWRVAVSEVQEQLPPFALREPDEHLLWAQSQKAQATELFRWVN